MSIRTVAFAALAAAVAACGPSPLMTDPILADGSASVVGEAARAAWKRYEAGRLESVTVAVRLIDSHGREVQTPALRLSWAAGDLTRVNRDAADGPMLVNLSAVEILSPYGVMALAEWCGRYRPLTSRLCASGRRSAEEAWALRVEAGVQKRRID